MSPHRFVSLHQLCFATCLALVACDSGDGDGAAMDTDAGGTTDESPVTSTTGGEATGDDTDASGEEGSTTGEDELVPCDRTRPIIVVETTLGTMVLGLEGDKAPNTVANFMDYVDSGFYEGTIFHRVMPGFMAQGGGHTADLTLKETNPPIDMELHPDLRHVDGAVAMARPDDDLNGADSQFYICDGAQHFLDDNYAVFGVLVKGQEVLDAIMASPTGSEGGLSDVPTTDIVIETVTCVGEIPE